MIANLRTKAAVLAVASGVLLAVSLPTTAQAVDAYPPGVRPVSCKVKVVQGGNALRVNMGPNQPGSRYYTFRVDVKRGGLWYRTVRAFKTQGTSETRTLDLPRGTYRARCNGKFGFTSATSRTVRLTR
jgi:hypothetical protein